MADDDFLQPDVPDYGDEREHPQARDVDEELPGEELGDDGAPEDDLGLTPPD
jgi:hypothetical protein